MLYYQITNSIVAHPRNKVSGLVLRKKQGNLHGISGWLIHVNFTGVNEPTYEPWDDIWVNYNDLTSRPNPGIMVYFRKIIPKWPDYSG